MLSFNIATWLRTLHAQLYSLIWHCKNHIRTQPVIYISMKHFMSYLSMHMLT